MKKSLALLSALSFATAGFAGGPADAPGLKATGFLQYRYEWTENPRLVAEDLGLAWGSDAGNAYVDSKSETSTQLALFLDNQFDGKTRFHAWLQAQHLSGRTTNTYVTCLEAYVAAKFGPAEVAVGRFLSDVGFGTLGGAPFMDGVHVTVGNKMVTGQVYVTKFGAVRNAYAETPGIGAQNTHMTFVSADVKVRPVQGLTLSAAYFADVTSEDAECHYKSMAFGAEYQWMMGPVPFLNFQAEYAKNNSDGAKFLRNFAGMGYWDNPDKAPIAYFGKVKFLGANPFMPGTGGVSLQYRRAEAGFDAMAMADPFSWNAPFNWTSPAQGGCADNHKGFELAGEITVLPRTIVKAAYGLMKTTNTQAVADLGTTSSHTTDSQKYFTAQVFYLF